MLLAAAAVALVGAAVLAQPPSTAQPEGLRDNTPAVHALVNARLVLAPGRTIDKGTVVIRDGTIVAVGASDDTSPPADARVWDLAGRTVYPGIIDAYGELPDGSGGATGGRGGRTSATLADEATGQELLRSASATGGAAYWNPRVTPQFRADQQYRPDPETNRKLRSQGIVARLVAPSRQVIKGTSAAVATGDADGTRSVLRGVVALHLQLAPVGAPFSERAYPASPMGAVALVRQAMYDAQWYAKARAAWEADPALPRPERNDALEALQPAVAGSLPVVVDTTDEKYALRAERLATEFKLNVMIRGSGQEYRRIDEIAATGRPVIVPVNFAKPPNVASPELAMGYSLEELMDWDLQPENPGRLEKAGVKIALTSQGLRDKAEYLKSVRKAVARGLPAEAALRALTVAPAELLGLSRSHGTIEVGKSAGLVVTDGDLFDEKTQVLETWVDGTRYEVTALPKEDARGTWAVKLGDDAKPVSIKLTGEPTKLKGRLTTGPASSQPAGGLFSWPWFGGGKSGGKRDGTELANLTYAGSQVSFTLKGDALHLDGVVQVSATVSGDRWVGTGVRPDGSTFAVSATRSAPYSKEDEKKDAEARTRRRSRPGAAGEAKEAEGEDDTAGEVERPQVAREGAGRPGARPTTRPAEPSAPAAPEAVASVPARPEPPPGERERSTTAVTTPPPPAGAAPATQPAPTALARQAEKASTKPSLFPVNYPLGAFGRAHEPEQPDVVLFKDATVWTSGPRGKLAKASVLVERGKISAVYAEGEPVKELPAGAVVVDCTGIHLSPGIIDCHSHIATDGGINESSRSITCQVRIGDFIDPDDVNIYRQLAGGVTAANVLHGSANTIGGQNQVIKMRWGASAEGMKFAEAPAGVKFALGENVKRSNSDTPTRAGAAPPRYPLSRMGVEQLVRDAFSAARDYRRAWDQFKASGGKGIPPRVDLELEALAEIVEGRRMIHCHSYRQDEILALVRTCEQFGVKVATFQHVLEGYKVADALAKHGAGGSTFSDWWAYKYEAWDAIPYNGALMREAGVTVSFNSDDAELARRLNTEAAKSEKYGGVPEEEALKFVTLNPAKQLKIDAYVGSIEPGKHADLVVWSGSPLSGLSRCEQTWVDGRRYFDRREDQEMRKQNQSMRAALVQKILTGGEKPGDEDEREPRPRDAWKHDHEENRACDCGVIWRR
jgi:N-acetylglucosamine-6-phosphate deacetylase